MRLDSEQPATSLTSAEEAGPHDEAPLPWAARGFNLVAPNVRLALQRSPAREYPLALVEKPSGPETPMPHWLGELECPMPSMTLIVSVWWTSGAGGGSRSRCLDCAQRDQILDYRVEILLIPKS